MTSIYTNGFMGPQTERAWNDGLEYTDFDGGHPPTELEIPGFLLLNNLR